MPRTLVQGAAFVLGMWLAIELVQPVGLVGARGLQARSEALPAVSAPPRTEAPSAALSAPPLASGDAPAR